MINFRIGRNVLLTLAGLALPLVMGAFSIPFVVEKLGTARFGVLTLIWGIFGYFSLFDFGIGKALTKRVAEAGNDSVAAARSVRAGLLLLLVLGAISGCCLGLSYSFLLALGIVSDTPENFRSLMWLAVGMPFLFAGIGLRGILEGLGRFGSPAIARIILGISTFGLPIPLLAYWPTLDLLVIGLIIGRLITTVSMGMSCGQVLVAAWRVRNIGAELKHLLGFGGWMMLSNLLSPLMVFADRFVVAASSVASYLAYYTTPFELVTRILVLPAAVTTVLFPMMARLTGESRGAGALDLMVRSMIGMFVVLLPIVLIGSVYSEDFLRWWLNPEFALLGATPMALLCWGVLLNSMAQFPFAYLQSMGKVRQIAFLHLFELPFYFLALPWFIGNWGIVGAAIAWVSRVGFDFVMLLVLVVSHRSQVSVEGQSRD